MQDNNVLDNNKNLIYMKSTDVKPLREKILKENNNICPILGVTINNDEAVLDHIHASNATGLGGDGFYGCIRGSIHSYANIILGKVENASARTGLNNYMKRLNDRGIEITLSQVLRNMADYLDNGAYEENNSYFIHPTEVPKPKKLQKSSYDALVKVLKQNNYTKKIPEYPKSKILTKGLQELFELYNVNITYYKD